MLELILALFKVNDLIRIHCTDGVYEGKILMMNQTSIALQSKDGKMCGVNGCNITSYESIDVMTSNTSPLEVPIATTESKPKPTLNPPDCTSNTDNTIEEKSKDVLFETGKPQIKIVDKIPLDKLIKIDPKLKEKKDKTSAPKKILGTGLDSLESLVKDIHDDDDKKIVPAKGYIYRCALLSADTDKAFGFILDSKSHKEIYFSYKEIVDKELLATIKRYDQVVYSIGANYQGQIATCIHSVKSVSRLIQLATQLSSNGDFQSALEVVNHILTEYPTNYSADKLKQELQKVTTVKPKEYSSLYRKAKDYANSKQFDLAFECYYKAIELGEREESCIKDVLSIFANLYSTTEDETEKAEYRRKAIEFMDQYEEQLPDTLSTWQHLENAYYSIRDFDNFYRVADYLLSEPKFSSNRNKYLALLAKKAAAKIRENKYDEASRILDDIFSADPYNQAAKKLKNIIEQPEGEADIDDYLENKFESLSVGLSPYIKQTIETYDEYAGLKQKIIDSGNYDQNALSEIRGLIDRTGSSRPRERAKFLLTEAKLSMELESNSMKLRSILARYCNAMAQNYISQFSPMDTIRFFYNEAFSLEESFDSLSRQVSLYLMTFYSGYQELLSALANANGAVSIDVSLGKALSSNNSDIVWDGILNMFLMNRSISANITSRLFDNQKYKKGSLEFLCSVGVDTSRVLSRNDYTGCWNKAREQRQADYERNIATIKAIGDVSTIEELAITLSASLRNCGEKSLRNCEGKWYCPLERQRLSQIYSNILPALENYLRSSGYSNKDSSFRNARMQISQLIDIITECPTKLSYEAMLPMLQKAIFLLTASFDKVVKASAPKLDIKLLSDNTVCEENVVSLQISVQNHKDSSPIRETSITIGGAQGISCIEEDNTSYDPINGGDIQIFKVKIHVSDDVIKNKAAALDVVCCYKDRDNIECRITVPVSLQLYSSKEYTPIDNPYSRVADGGPVPVDSNMFFGREQFISNIVDAISNSPSKQIIIYGQKRCGKSSVMLHLREKLKDTGKAFCILFSLGDIVLNISEASFFYKILSTIKDELDFLEMDDELVPEFELPKFSDFKAEDDENPLNTFSRYMIQFKQSCKRTDGWKDKNLVVMIDEFTYLYTAIKKGDISPTIMQQWKAITQNDKAQFSVVLVGQDVVPSFKKEDYARNAFGVIQDLRLTYLQEEPARNLIETPILDQAKCSRYVGNAVDRIIEYTSRNPYYIQIFCARLVDYMNKQKIIKVTEADVDDVANSFIEGDQALGEEKFDNLIRAGELADLQEIPDNDILEVLRKVAYGSKNIGYCGRNDILTSLDREYVDNILKNLEDREVLEKREGDNYKIQVKLFQKWLLNH